MGITALQMGQVFLTLAQCLKQSQWNTCFSEHGKMQILSFGTILMQQIAQSPPAFAMSLSLASLSSTSMIVLPSWFLAQQQQQMARPRQMSGERTMARQRMMSWNSVRPTTTTQRERRVMSRGTSWLVARTQMVQIMEMKDRTELRFQRFLTQGKRLFMMALMVDLAIFQCSLLPSASKSCSLMSCSAMYTSALTQFSTQEKSQTVQLGTACLAQSARLRQLITLPNTRMASMLWYSTPITEATRSRMKATNRSPNEQPRAVRLTGMRTMKMRVLSSWRAMAR